MVSKMEKQNLDCSDIFTCQFKKQKSIQFCGELYSGDYPTEHCWLRPHHCQVTTKSFCKLSWILLKIWRKKENFFTREYFTYESGWPKYILCWNKLIATLFWIIWIKIHNTSQFTYKYSRKRLLCVIKVSYHPKNFWLLQVFLLAWMKMLNQLASYPFNINDLYLINNIKDII